MFNSFTITTSAKSIIGSTFSGVTISKMMIGSGTSNTPTSLTSLVSPWQDLDIASSSADSLNKTINASAYLSNNNMTIPMSMSELGVYAIKNGTEFLLAYTCNQEYAEVIPSRSQTVDFVKLVEVAIAIDMAVEDYPSFISGTGLVTNSTMMAQINWLNNKKLDTAGGIISGDLEVKGDFVSRKTGNPVFCDYAELFEFDDMGALYKPNLILGVDHENPGEEYRYITSESTPVGIISDTYGQLLGGPERNGIEDYDKSEFAPVGLSGRVYLWIEGPIRKGDKVTVSNRYSGYGVKSKSRSDDIVGIALQTINREELIGASNFNRIKVLIK